MIIEYDVNCFERTLVVECPDSYAEHERKMYYLLDKYYFQWHAPDEIEDPEERARVEEACCEEYMVTKLREQYPECGEWDSFYYGDDKSEIADDRSKKINLRNWNIHWLKHTINDLKALQKEYEAFEKLGNDAYHILNVCIAQLENLKEEI